LEERRKEDGRERGRKRNGRKGMSWCDLGAATCLLALRGMDSPADAAANELNKLIVILTSSLYSDTIMSPS